MNERPNQIGFTSNGPVALATNGINWLSAHTAHIGLVVCAYACVYVCLLFVNIFMPVRFVEEQTVSNM